MVDSVHKPCRLKRDGAEWNRDPSAYQPNALPLGQTDPPVEGYLTDRFYMAVFSEREGEREREAETCRPVVLYNVTVLLYDNNDVQVKNQRIGFVALVLNNVRVTSV